MKGCIVTSNCRKKRYVCKVWRSADRETAGRRTLQYGRQCIGVAPQKFYCTKLGHAATAASYFGTVLCDINVDMEACHFGNVKWQLGKSGIYCPSQLKPVRLQSRMVFDINQITNVRVIL